MTRTRSAIGAHTRTQMTPRMRETIPPVDRVPSGSSRRLCYPMVTDPAAPPPRPERHMPNSIATTRRRLTAALVRTLPPALSTRSKMIPSVVVFHTNERIILPPQGREMSQESLRVLDQVDLAQRQGWRRLISRPRSPPVATLNAASM
jgi:hypothetical protein